ncbi:MarR family winged helix-turn-helix transcriptional regulator [Ideonella sp.]|uniref:MarR family winged helix-turn-helix transcriptional regulator n=1 Tax=Ideonella sp. TaxID=1929293 RepID=UPI0035B177AC
MPAFPVPDADSVASAFLDAVPGAMDALRLAMRAHVGDQLSVPQFRCLNYIGLHPGSSVGAVARFLGVSLPTASAMVDRLVKAGAVAPGTATDDRRRSALELTPAGRDQLDTIRRGAHAELALWLSPRSADDLRTLHAGLLLLRQLFGRPVAPTAAPSAPPPSSRTA